MTDDLTEDHADDALFTRLAGIEVTARGGGVAATVNLEGRLTGLTLSPEVLALTPDELAERIFRLTQEASATALSEGFDALVPVVGEDVTARLRAEIDSYPPVVSPPRSRSSATGPAWR